MFRGNFTHSIDKKGRIFVPVKFRDDIGTDFVIVNSIDKSLSLSIYSAAEWKKICDKIELLPYDEALEISRYFISSAMDVAADTQGRVCIPQMQRVYAELETGYDAIITGVLNHIEIWNLTNWNGIQNDVTKDKVKEILNKL